MNGLTWEVDGPEWDEAAVEVYARWLAESLRAPAGGPPWVHVGGRGGFGRRWLRGLTETGRGPRVDLTWVDETVSWGVDPNEARAALTRRRDLVDECVAVTLREPTWLTEGRER